MSKPIKLARVELDERGVRDPAATDPGLGRRANFTSQQYNLILLDNRLLIRDPESKRTVLVPWTRVLEAVEESA